MKPVEVCKGNLFETKGMLGVAKKALGIYFLLLVKHTCNPSINKLPITFYVIYSIPTLLLINTHLQEFVDVFTSLMEDFMLYVYVDIPVLNLRAWSKILLIKGNHLEADSWLSFPLGSCHKYKE